MRLKCFCDHCPNNTCTTPEGGLCWAQYNLDKNGEIEKKYNCFNKDSKFIQSLICDETPSETSSEIRRCCSDGDYCNSNVSLMPTFEEAKYTLRNAAKALSLTRSTNPKQLPPEAATTTTSAQLHQQQQQWKGSLGAPAEFMPTEYSNLPIEFKLVIIILSGLLLIFAVALIQNCFHRSNSGSGNTSRRRNRTQRTATATTTTTTETRPSFTATTTTATARIKPSPTTSVMKTGPTTSLLPPKSHVGELGAPSGVGLEDDGSENLSNKAYSDVAIYDTNSMASREPLINNTTALNQNVINSFNKHLPSSLDYHPNPKRGPYMTAEESYTHGRPRSAFQMTIGSGTTTNKPETSSGSGAGQPYLTQRSIAHDIELQEVVGRGYFGIVWRGEYKGEPVAVKIFAPMAEPSWEREAEIYQTTMLRHKNILGFIATDKRYDASITGFWLVTDFYAMGSLYDFLKDNSMAMPDAVRMAFSIANGLAHLHTEIFGTQGKPAIAHRDLKSKNILVKNDGTCCIGDLGMAVRYNSNTGVVDVPANSRVGTRRYLAPELLENRLNLMDFDAVKATDVYALGLILWEVLRRACFIQPPSSPNHPDPILSTSLEQPVPLHNGSSPSSSHSGGAHSPSHQQASAQETISSSSLTMLEISEPKQSIPKQQSTIAKSSFTSTNVETQVREAAAAAAVTREIAFSHESQREPLLGEATMDTSVDDMNSELALLCDPYEAPYQQYVSIDPSTDEMREVVCIRKLRPPTSFRWTKFAPMRDYVILMSECWYEKPLARLSALRIRKSLGEIARHYFNLNMEYD